MVKTIELKKSDYDYYEQFGMYRIKSGHYEKHPPCEKYITKRCGNKENYWGFLGEDDEEYKIKWIEDVGLKCGHPHEKERDYGNNYCYSCEMESVFAPPPAGICPETGKKLEENYDCKYCGIETNGSENFTDSNDKIIYICGGCDED